ncbi:MAG: BatD family protein [Saprospiraceae bacterium]
MRLALILFIFQSFGFFAFAQAPSFVVNVDHTEISLDEYIEVSFTLEDGQGQSFRPPDFNGWTVVNGPSTSSQISIINGIRNASVSYIYSLAPKSTGSLTIGKASIQINGKTIYTNAIIIKVSKSNPNRNLTHGSKGLSKKDIFIIAKATPEKGFVGQQILVEYKLYTAVNVDNFNIAHAPEFNGFHVNNTPRGSFDSREMLNGRQYVTKVIYTASIYPIQSGSFDLEALHVRANVVIDGNNDPNSFFLLPNTEGVELVSNTVPLKVLSLPDPVPPNFSGAVGRYQLAASIDQSNVKVNDAISVSVYLEGDGDLNRVGKPFIETDTTAFQNYEPKITKENTDYKMNGFIGMRELVYPLVVKKPGTFLLRPSFVYFDTDSQRYLTISPRSFTVNVSGTAFVQSGKPSASREESKKLLALIQNPSLGQSQFVGTVPYFIVMSFPFLLLGLLLLRKKIFEKSIHSNIQSAHLSKLKQDTLQNLDKIGLDQTAIINSRVSIGKINDLLKTYLKTKWNISEQTISTAQWYEYIDKLTLDDSIKLKIKLVLQESEFAIYGVQMTKEQLLSMIGRAKEIVENC